MRRRGWLGLVAALLASGLALGLTSGLAAQDVPGPDFAGLARLDPLGSRVGDEGARLGVVLALSQPVPWRLFTLDDPPRLVLELRAVDWGPEDGLLAPGLATDLRTGDAGSGWSRLVLDLAGPLAVEEAGMAVDDADGAAVLRVVMAPTDAAAFAAVAGAPPDAGWAAPAAAPTDPPPDAFVVAIDPGHGGIDPGAEREGLREAHMMLALGIELSEAVARAGWVPVLTRRADVFVPLAERMTIARAAGADVMLSLHADALEADAASGASVYTLSPEGAGQASARMVERHERGDLLAGLDLSAQDDPVATALMDLARRDTAPRADRLAVALAREMERAGARVNGHALRQAPLAVLNAADFPSVLIEAGFLSDAADRAALSSPEGRAPLVAGIVAALAVWSAEEAARGSLRLR